MRNKEHEDGVGDGTKTIVKFVGRYTIVNRSHRICCRKDTGWVVKKTHGPVCM